MKLQFNLQHNLKKEETIASLKLVLFKAMLKMHELAVGYCPVDTGRLKGTIKIFPMVPGFNKYILHDGVDYGIHMEYGTSPHYVSASNLKGWASRVLGDANLAYAVGSKIAMKGVEAHPFMRPALKQVKDVYLKQLLNEQLDNNT